MPSLLQAISYIANISEASAYIFKSNLTRVVHRPTGTLRNPLMLIKGRSDPSTEPAGFLNLAAIFLLSRAKSQSPENWSVLPKC